jgi:hypothetical protein
VTKAAHVPPRQKSGVLGDERPIDQNIFYTTKNEAFANIDDVFVTIWRADTTVAGICALDVKSEEFQRRRPHGIGMLTVVEARTPMPTAPARQAIAAFLHRGSGFIRGSAVLFDGNSFRSSAVRGVATGLNILARPPFPHKFFVDAHEALSFLVSTLPATVTHAAPERMLGVLTGLRRRIDEMPSTR